MRKLGSSNILGITTKANDEEYGGGEDTTTDHSPSSYQNSYQSSSMSFNNNSNNSRNNNNNKSNSNVSSPVTTTPKSATTPTTTTRASSSSALFNMDSSSSYQSSSSSSLPRSYSSSSSSSSMSSHIGTIKSNYYQTTRRQQQQQQANNNNNNSSFNHGGGNSGNSPWSIIEVIQDMLQYIYTSIVQPTFSYSKLSSSASGSNLNGGGSLSRSNSTNQVSHHGSDFPQVEFALDRDTKQYFEAFKSFVSVQYDMSNERHERLLLQLWNLCMNPSLFRKNGSDDDETKKKKKNGHQSKKTIELKSRISEQWKLLGFQGTNPATDFRGSGVFGLENLIYFGENYPKLFRRLYRKTARDHTDGDESQITPVISPTTTCASYPFVIAGLNVTMMLHDILGIGMNARKCSNMVARRKLIEMICDCARVEGEQYGAGDGDGGDERRKPRQSIVRIKKQKRRNKSSWSDTDESDESDGDETTSSSSSESRSDKKKKKNNKNKTRVTVQQREANLLDFSDESYNVAPPSPYYSLDIDDGDDGDDIFEEQEEQREQKQTNKTKDKTKNPSSMSKQKNAGDNNSSDNNKSKKNTKASEVDRMKRFQVFHELYVAAFVMLDREWYRSNSTNYFCFPDVLRNTRQQMEDLIETQFDSLQDILEHNRAR